MPPMMPHQKGNKDFIRDKVLGTRKLGRKVQASAFECEIEGHPEYTLRVDSVDFPTMNREKTESSGAMGVKSPQYGNLNNMLEFPLVLNEHNDGKTLKFVQRLILDGEAVNIITKITPEEKGGVAIAQRRYRDCLFECDPVSLGNENGTELIKATINVTAVWCDEEI